MNLNPFKKKPKALDAEEEAGGGAIDDLGELGQNAASEKRQTMLLYGGGGALALVAMVWILQPSTEVEPGLEAANAEDEVEVSTDDLVNQRLTDKEWMALSENQLQMQGNQIRGLEGQLGRVETMQAEIDTLRAEKQAMTADGTRVLSAFESENQQLRQELAAAQAGRGPAVPGPAAMYGPGAPRTYRATGAEGAPAEAGIAMRSNEITLVSFGGEAGGTASPIGRGSTTYTDSPNYLPPNSIARAKVVVGVDATTSVRSQTDPLPVVLRITGPARSVYADGRLLRTNIEGCMVNGAAQGDLSSEKVYVRLQRMTCPQPGGRFAVSEVKGFIAFGGKTGVRGNVVSREGGLVSQAFLAGLVGGFGRGFSANSQAVFAGSQVLTDGERDQLSTGDILEGGFGSGVGEAGDMVSQYLIERAEQYQPVIEMPTGIDVEVVFLEGVFIRN